MKYGEWLFLLLGIVLLFLGTANGLRATCDSGNNNVGTITGYFCTMHAVDCGGDVCETDRCECLTGGGGGSSRTALQVVLLSRAATGAELRFPVPLDQENSSKEAYLCDRYGG